MLPAKNLLLLSCRSPFLDDSKIYCPLANHYLKSYLNEYLPDVEVTLGDDAYDPEGLDGHEPFDAVGISIMTPQRFEAIRLARQLKTRWPTTTVIAGGPHIKYYCSEAQREGCFDYLVPLDGEKALVEILTNRAADQVVTSTLSRVEVANQPPPDRRSANALEVIRRYTYSLNGRSATTLMTARGCPERCTFCEDALTAIRWTSLDGIKAQLDDIVSAGYRAVYIFDDLFAISLPTIRPICEELQKRDLIYRCNAQARYFTRWGDEMARLLAATGCYEIAFGAESGSQTILDNVQKRCSVEQNYQTVAFAKRHGLIVKAFILLGLPGETWKTLHETEQFIAGSGIDDFQCAVYMPFKGTSIRRALDAGQEVDLRIEAAGRDGDVTGAYGIVGGETAYEVRTGELSAQDLRQFRDYLVATYRPQSHRRRWDPEDKFFDQAFHVATSAGTELANVLPRAQTVQFFR